MLYVNLVLMFLISLILVAFPSKVVSWWATYFRIRYPDKDSLERADRMMVFNPLNRPILGSISEFATRGPEHPEDFPRAIVFIQIIGLLPLIGSAFALMIFILPAIGGISPTPH